MICALWIILLLKMWSPLLCIWIKERRFWFLLHIIILTQFFIIDFFTFSNMNLDYVIHQYEPLFFKDHMNLIIVQSIHTYGPISLRACKHWQFCSLFSKRKKKVYYLLSWDWSGLVQSLEKKEMLTLFTNSLRWITRVDKILEFCSHLLFLFIFY